MEFEIKITGSGTKQELEKALQQVVDNIKASTDEELDGSQWEDPTLMTEIDSNK